VRVAIVSIGEELILGRSRDRAGARVARALSSLGIRPAFITISGGADDEVDATLEEASGRCDVLIVVGGVGPGREAPETGEDDTAASRVEKRAAQVFYLPADPPALEVALERQVLPALARRRPGKVFSVHRLRVSSRSREEVAEVLGELGPLPEGLAIELSSEGPELVLSIRAAAASQREALHATRRLGAEVCARLGHDVHGPMGQDLAQALSEAFRSRGWTLATVEVGTGGVVPELLSMAEERATFLRLGLTVDDPTALPPELGSTIGEGDRGSVVSASVAKALAGRVRRFGGATVGLALVGLPGPRGGSTETPVGLVHFAVTDGEGERYLERRFHSMPLRRRGQWIAAAALRLALDHCREKGG